MNMGQVLIRSPQVTKEACGGVCASCHHWGHEGAYELGCYLEQQWSPKGVLLWGPCLSRWPAWPPGAMVTIWPGLLWTTTFGQLPESVLMSLPQVAAKDHMDDQGLVHNPWSCWCPRALLLPVPGWLSLSTGDMVSSRPGMLPKGHVWVCGSATLMSVFSETIKDSASGQHGGGQYQGYHLGSCWCQKVTLLWGSYQFRWPTSTIWDNSPGLLPKTVSGSVVLPPPRSVLMSMVYVSTKGYIGFWSLCCTLQPCFCKGHHYLSGL